MALEYLLTEIQDLKILQGSKGLRNIPAYVVISYIRFDTLAKKSYCQLSVGKVKTYECQNISDWLD